MNSMWRGRRRGLLGATVVATTMVLTAGFGGPASADPTTPPAGDQAAIDAYVQKYDHEMGSQIRRHEGTAQMPRDGSPPSLGAEAAVEGIDVSGHQGNVDWPGHWNAGRRFVWVKATEGTGYINPYFPQQYTGSYDQGFIRGAYHFALPDRSSGAAQANYFSDNGGGWSGDGRTLPGALDVEYNPYGASCYGLSPADMTAWIKSFSDTYKARWSKFPAIYTSTNWWNQCVGSSFSTTNPLWVARYASSIGALPFDWSVHTVWQYSSSPLDRNSFNGSYDRLVVFATNHD